MSEHPINTFDQIETGDVAISYFSDNGRGHCRYSSVWRKGFRIDPDGPWYYNGDKGFAGIRKESLAKAMEWASKRYGVKKWKRNGMGDYIDAEKPYKPLRCEIERKAKRTAST